MLDKNIFTFKMNELLMAFPSWKIKYDDPDTMKFWYMKFRKMDDKRFVYMVDSYMDGENFPPTIKGLNDHDNIPRKSIDQLRHEQALKDEGLYD